MSAKTILIKSSYITAVSLIFLAVVGLLFRATLYWAIPVAPNQSMGGGDVIELLFYFGILSLAGLVMVMSVIIALLRNYKIALIIFVSSLVVPICYIYLHQFVPKLM